MSIQITTLDSSPTSIFTSTSNLASIGPSGASAVTTIYFCNNDTSALSLSVYVVPMGQTVSPNHIIYNTLQIASLDTYVLDTERLMFDAGDQIFATASVAGLIIATVSFIGI